MKIKILLLFILISSIGFSQSVNDYKAVIVPTKYDFMKIENQYRLATVTKLNLQKAGFTAFYSNEELPQEYNGQRCNLLNIDVVKQSAFLATKLIVVFKDCYGKIVFTSEIGKSKIKEYELAYREALNEAFVSVNTLNYKYNGRVFTEATKSTANNVTVPVATTTVVAVAPSVSSTVNSDSANLLYAQPTETGYQLIDKTPKVVMKLMKTSRADSFIAIKDGIQGNLILKDNQWFFEYYKDDKMMSELILVKF